MQPPKSQGKQDVKSEVATKKWKKINNDNAGEFVLPS